MKETKLLEDVFEQLNNKFQSNWIDSLQWTNTLVSKNSMSKGLTSIRELRSIILVNFARFALGGKQFVESYETINKIQEWSYDDVVINRNRNKYKTALLNEYRGFIFDVLDSVNLLHYHIDNTKELFSSDKKRNYINAVKRYRPTFQQSDSVKLLETIIDVCWAEYCFSFNESFIQNLLQSKEVLKEALNKSTINEKLVVNAAIKKIDLMLCKLAVFSKDKQISYKYNFQQSTLSWESIEKDVKDKFHIPFIQFLKPESLSNKDIEDWQKDSWGDNIAMWKLVLLMRYYSKHTKNQFQIDKVLEIYDRHYDESIQEPNNMINDYAARSVKNYMYNCRFSFLCQYKDKYTADKLQEDLEQIESIQNETFIKNYHPYQKAYVFLRKEIEEGLNNYHSQKILEKNLKLLKYCFEKFKENVAWCQSNQPYIYQLRFKYCTDNWDGVEVFCPSSYCRPLRFKELNDCKNEYANEIWTLEQKIKNNPDRLRILSAHEEIDNITKKNYELLSFFSTVVIFLVGLISIFIGNTASMQEKMEYVIVLGSILLLFVCLGYFVAGKRFDEHKPKIFGTIGIVLLVILCHYYFCWLPKQFASKEEHKKDVVEVQNTKE